MRIAIVDDDDSVRRVLRRVLERDHMEVVEFADGKAIAKGAADFDLVCLDLSLGGVSGLDVLKHLKAETPDVPVVMVTGNSDVDTVVAVMRAGADEYVTKPVGAEHLRLAVRRALDRSNLEKSVVSLKSELDGMRGKRTLVGSSPAMRALVTAMDRVLASDVAVCILGESGTGKELVARAIHDDGRRMRGPFVAINCASIPEHLQESELFGHEKGSFTGATGTYRGRFEQAQDGTLFLDELGDMSPATQVKLLRALQESELFGHEKGAFTGATATYRGRFEQAQGGTLFLDELGDMSPATQVKLLRALQEKAIRRVGGTTDIDTNLRVIGATHRDLEAMVRAGAFREDLYFRLMVYPIEMPPLRERKGDIPALIGHLMERHREDVGRALPKWSAEALDALMAHDWPGNVRELENVVHRAMLTAAGGRVGLADLPKVVRAPALPVIRSFTPPAMAAVRPAAPASRELPPLQLRQLEDLAIHEALEQVGGHIANAAKLLGIGRATLYRRITELDTPAAVPGSPGSAPPSKAPSSNDPDG